MLVVGARRAQPRRCSVAALLFSCRVYEEKMQELYALWTERIKPTFDSLKNP